MVLTEEDRQRIYEEEKARLEAREKVWKEEAIKRTKRGCGGCLLIILLVVGLAQISDALRITAVNAGMKNITIMCMQCGERDYGQQALPELEARFGEQLQETGEPE